VDDQHIRQLIREKEKGNRISCRTAMEIAKEVGVPTHKIGELLNDMEIKIHSCQLGCFK
jgi:hypothetical protein